MKPQNLERVVKRDFRLLVVLVLFAFNSDNGVHSLGPSLGEIKIKIRGRIRDIDTVAEK